MGSQEFTTKTESVLIKGREMRVTHLIPVLSPEERARRKREIESQLYDVFSKYQNSES